MGGLKARRAAAMLAGMLLVQACRGSNTEYDGPFQAEVNAAIPRIEQAMGVPFRQPPRLETRTREQVREFLEIRFAEDLPHEELSASETVYKRLGLVADSLDLRSLYMSLLTEQIVGFYDPRTKVLYVVEEAPVAQRAAIITHELIHALQDQYADLLSLQRVRNDNDRALAAQSVIEGQAMFKQLEAMMEGGAIATRLPGGWERVRQSIRDNRATMPLFAAAPMIMQETMIFPYLSGAEFVRRENYENGAAAFERLPASTEQVMHPGAYGDTIDAPTRVIFGDSVRSDAMYENGLGEFETRVLLFEHLGDQNAAVRGAAGWDGDRFQLFERGGADAVAWVSVWDTENDAAEFAELITDALARRYGQEDLPDDARSFSANGRRVTVTRAESDGRPLVLVEDVAAAVSGGLLDLSTVRLDESPATVNVIR